MLRNKQLFSSSKTTTSAVVFATFNSSLSTFRKYSSSTNSNDNDDDLATSSASSNNKDNNNNTSLEHQHQNNNSRDLDQRNADSGGGSMMMEPNAAFAARTSQRAVDAGRITPEARAYYLRLQSTLGATANPLLEHMRTSLGDQDPRHMTQYQQRILTTQMAHVANAVFAKDTKAMFNEQKGMKDFAENGTPTGENYWFEAGGTLTSPDLPREMKDDLFAEMKKDRPSDSDATKGTGFNQ